MNILSEPLVNYIILFSFLIFFFPESWSAIYLKNCDFQFIQTHAAILYVVYFCK